MTSSIVKDLMQSNPAMAKSIKTRKTNPVSRKMQYIAKKEKNSKLKITLNKILNPIAQELLATIIKLEKNPGFIVVKSDYDHKQYK